jgi:hypothetical protein
MFYCYTTLKEYNFKTFGQKTTFRGLVAHLSTMKRFRMCDTDREFSTLYHGSCFYST